jgi:hypothetical protein
MADDYPERQAPPDGERERLSVGAGGDFLDW